MPTSWPRFAMSRRRRGAEVSVRPFSYIRAADGPSAIATLAADSEAAFVAGGTTLLDLMKDEIESPRRLVDISRLSLTDVELTGEGLRIGALATMSAVARAPAIVHDYPVIAEALIAGASAQLRN